MIVDGFRHQKGRPGCQTALVLSLAKITIFFNNLLDSRKGFLLGIESGRDVKFSFSSFSFSSIWRNEVLWGQMGPKILHPRLTPYPERTSFCYPEYF